MTPHLAGIGVSPGIVSGPVAKLAPPPTLAAPGPVGDTETETAAATAALEAVAADLQDRSRRGRVRRRRASSRPR